MNARDPHQHALVAAARRLGLQVTDPWPALGVDRVVFGRPPGHPLGPLEVPIIDGCIYASLSHQTELICADKRATKRILSAIGLPCPRDLVITAEQAEQEVAEAIQTLAPNGPGLWVVKPLCGTNGDGVLMDLAGDGAVLAAVNQTLGALPAGDAVLIERQLPGQDLRLQAIGDPNDTLIACVRHPAHVVGDGQQTIQALVAARDALVRSQNPQNYLKIGAVARQLLAARGQTLASVPAAGEIVTLQRVANIGRGGTAVDVTDTVHPDYRRWIAAAANVLGLEIFALDVITPDPAAAPASVGAQVIEVNARPQWMHHTFSEVRQHDMASLILKYLLGLR